MDNLNHHPIFYKTDDCPICKGEGKVEIFTRKSKISQTIKTSLCFYCKGVGFLYVNKINTRK